MMVFICVFILIRAALPRPRYDQLMASGWKVMLPLALLNLVVTGAVVLARAGGADAVMWSSLRTIWRVFLHMFAQARDHPVPGREEAKLAPRWRGRIILTRDPDGGERCVACYLCAVACPVDCIALQATEDRGRAALPGVLPHQFLALHLLRLLRGGLPDLRHPAHARLRDERVQPQEPGVREGRPAHRRPGQVPGLQLLPRRRHGHRRQGQGRGDQRGTSRSTRGACCPDHSRSSSTSPRLVAVVASLLVVTRSNAVHALLYLIVSLLGAAVVFSTLGAPFAAALEVILYAGAIMVLFVFVLMMLDLRGGAIERERSWLAGRHLDRPGGARRGPARRAAVDAARRRRRLAGGRVVGADRGRHRALRPLRRSASSSPAFLLLGGAGRRLPHRSARACVHAGRKARGPLMAVPYTHALALAAILFAIGLAGVLARRNLIFVLMSIEIMLNAAGLALVAAGAQLGPGRRPGDVPLRPAPRPRPRSRSGLRAWSTAASAPASCETVCDVRRVAERADGD